MNNLTEVVIHDRQGFICCAKKVQWMEKWIYSTDSNMIAQARMRGVPELNVTGIKSTKGLNNRMKAAKELFELVEYVVSLGVDRGVIEYSLKINRDNMMMVMSTAWCFNYSLGFYKKCANVVLNIWTSGNYAVYNEAVRTIKRELNTKLIA